MTSKKLFLDNNFKIAYSNIIDVMGDFDKYVDEMIESSKCIRQECIKENKKNTMSHIVKMREMSMDMVIGKCSILKASLDRLLIAHEDTIDPTRSNHMRLIGLRKDARTMRSLRFRAKISKTNMPSEPLPVQIIEEDDDLNND